MAMNVFRKTAIVTGAGSGINHAFAKLLLSKKCNVILADLALRPEAKNLVDEYSKGKETRALFLKTDVTKWSQLSKMFETAEQEFGNADIVVPGVGVFEPPWSNFWQPPGSLDSAARDTIEGSRYAALDINVTHPIRTTQLAIAHFLKHNKPGVVNIISSVAGQIPNLACPMYSASKHAMHGFVRSLAALEEPYALAIPGNLKVASDKKRSSKWRDLPPIRVNAVAPGLIKTPLWTDHPEKMQMAEKVEDWISPEEVAEAMLKCVQDKDFVGGSIIEIAGQGLRRVESFNDSGPPLTYEKSEPEKLAQEVWDRLSAVGWGQ